MIKFTDVGRGITDGLHGEFLAAFGSLEWVETERGKRVELPFSEGYLIGEALRMLPGGRMSHYAFTSVGGRAVVAIRREGFKSGSVNVFIVDGGSIGTVIASEFVPDSVQIAA